CGALLPFLFCQPAVTLARESTIGVSAMAVDPHRPRFAACRILQYWTPHHFMGKCTACSVAAGASIFGPDLARKIASEQPTCGTISPTEPSTSDSNACSRESDGPPP